MINCDKTHLNFHIEPLTEGCHCCYDEDDVSTKLVAVRAKAPASVWSALNEQLDGRRVAGLDLAASDKYIRLWLAQ